MVLRIIYDENEYYDYDLGEYNTVISHIGYTPVKTRLLVLSISPKS